MTEERLTQAQFTQLVGEVERLSRSRDQELNRDQMQEILQELNLPTDLVDEAMMQLRRREALARQQKQNKLITVGVISGLAVVIVAGFLWFNRQQQILNNIYVNSEQSQLTLETNSGRRIITIIDSKQNPEVFYRVTLQDAPVGKKLSLGCNWINPSSEITHQNRYQTRDINQEVWPTYCRYQFNPGLPTGKWQVEMYLGDRLLSQTEFTVK
ncbi:MAG: transmembrane domain-containing protein [Microcoleaceae cyanobacterium MO_207.B10]|nr:transmembrane domain-containing protein [Microcoleaceae cyanobacterium MO_207.B10]